MKILLNVVYDNQTKRLGYRCDPPDLFTEKRDYLYIIIERLREEVMLQLTGQGGPTTVIDEPITGTFGKGTKTNVDG